MGIKQGLLRSDGSQKPSLYGNDTGNDEMGLLHKPRKKTERQAKEARRSVFVV